MLFSIIVNKISKHRESLSNIANKHRRVFCQKTKNLNAECLKIQAAETFEERIANFLDSFEEPEERNAFY